MADLKQSPDSFVFKTDRPWPNPPLKVGCHRGPRDPEQRPPLAPHGTRGPVRAAALSKGRNLGRRRSGGLARTARPRAAEPRRCGGSRGQHDKVGFHHGGFRLRHDCGAGPRRPRTRYPLRLRPLLPGRGARAPWTQPPARLPYAPRLRGAQALSVRALLLSHALQEERPVRAPHRGPQPRDVGLPWRHLGTPRPSRRSRHRRWRPSLHRRRAHLGHLALPQPPHAPGRRQPPA